MPRSPFFSGPIASAVMPQSPVMRQTGLDPRTAERIGNSIGGVFERYFYDEDKDPEAQRAKLLAAQRANQEEELAASGRANNARTSLSGDLAEYGYRGGASAPTSPALGTTPYDIAETIPSDAPAAAPGSSKPVTAVAGSALQRALASGGDSKELTPIMRAFMLSAGDDEGIVRTNAALEAKYLGNNQSPSLARQDTVREDEQAQDMAKHDGDLRMRKYGFDTASADRRYDTDTDAGTQRRGQDITAGTQRRGQDMTDDRTRDIADKRIAAAADTVQTVTTVDRPATKGTPAKSKFLGMFGNETPATPGRPKTRTTTIKKSSGAKADPLGIR